MEKVALIEITDAATILSIYQTQNGRSKIIRREQDNVNIYKDVTEENLLKPKTISDVVAILRLYRSVVEESNVNKIISIAHGLILRARNQRGFFEEVYNNTGLSFSYFSDDEVVKNLYCSVSSKIDNSKGTICYVTPSATYLVKYNRRTTLGHTTIPYGYENINLVGKTFDEMKKAMLAKLSESGFSTDGEEPFVGVGNPFINLGRVAKKLAHYPLDIDNNYEVSNTLQKKVTSFIKTLDTEKIKKVKGLMEDKTEVLVSGLALISAVYEKYNVKQLSISTASVGGGVINASIANEVQERYSDLLGSSFDNIFEFEKTEMSNNLRVANMSAILFKQLKVMHKLPRAYVKPLRLASYMYDCGKKVNFEQYEKQGFEVILNSGLCGVTQKELLLGAFICLCQTADNFNLSQWMKYKDLLTDEDLNAVRKLGIIVKLAVALNSSKKLVVTDVVCDILGDSIIMKLVVNSDPSYEIMQGMKVAKDYRVFFKKNLQLI